jgi:hypothetical protein
LRRGGSVLTFRMESMRQQDGNCVADEYSDMHSSMVVLTPFSKCVHIGWETTYFDQCARLRDLDSGHLCFSLSDWIRREGVGQADLSGGAWVMTWKHSERNQKQIQNLNPAIPDILGNCILPWMHSLLWHLFPSAWIQHLM